jgi:hypothetical protein
MESQKYVALVPMLIVVLAEVCSYISQLKLPAVATPYERSEVTEKRAKTTLRYMDDQNREIPLQKDV